MGADGFCSSCDDNFIVNKSFLTCNFCQKKYHTHCMKMKDSCSKIINESDGLYWYCETCRPVVDTKLSANLSSFQLSQSLLDSIKTTVHTAVMSLLDDFGSQQARDFRTLKDAIQGLSSQIEVLKDSNVDMIRLFTGGNLRPVSPVSNLDESNGNLSMPGGMLGGPVLRPAPPASLPALYGAPATSLERVRPSASETAVRNSTRGPAVNVLQPRLPASPRNTRVPSRNLNTAPSASKKGCGGGSDLLKPAPKGRSWIWLGNLAKSTSAEMVSEHFKSIHPNKDVLVFDLKSKSSKKSFKVGSSDLTLETLQSPSNWPDGLLIRPFHVLPKNL